MESKKKEVKGGYRGERNRKEADGERWKVKGKKWKEVIEENGRGKRRRERDEK
jgi:hypothetical protein